MSVVLSVEAVLTNTARTAIAKMLELGRSFKITHFILGDQGHDPTDPTIALTPDPAVTGCMGNVFGPTPITSVSYANASCPVFRCKVLGAAYTGPISSVCLVGTYVYSPILGDPLLGTTFTVAVATRPLLIKSDVDDLILDIAVQA
jgi:hypothetical protein